MSAQLVICPSTTCDSKTLRTMNPSVTCGLIAKKGKVSSTLQCRSLFLEEFLVSPRICYVCQVSEGCLNWSLLYTHWQQAECLGVHFNGFCLCTPCKAITFHSVRDHNHKTYVDCSCVRVCVVGICMIIILCLWCVIL